MKKITLVFLFNCQEQILLSMRKRNPGMGKWSWTGGKIEPWETTSQGAVRELFEEIWAKIEESSLQLKGILHFVWEGAEAKNQICSVFFVPYGGEVYETEEVLPKWFDISEIPYDEMWEDDIVWLPKLLEGVEYLEYRFVFSEEDKIKEVVNLLEK